MADPSQGRGRGIVRRIYANLGLLIGGKAAAGVISLVYMMIAARALGPAGYGVLILVHGYAMAVGGIVEFPGWHAIVRYGAQALEAGDRGRLVRLLRFAAGIEAIGGLASVVVAAALAPLIGPPLGWSPEAQGFATLYSLAVLASIRATPAGYLQLVGRFDLLGAHGTVAPMVRLAGAIVAALAGAGLHGFLLTWLLAALAEWLAMWALGLWVARSHVAGHRLFGRATGARRENPGIWRFMIAANADITFTELSGRMVPLVIGWVMGPVAAGLYAIAQRAGVVIQQPAQILGQAAYAEFARLVAGGGGRAHDAALRRALWRCVALALAMALPVVLVMMVVARPLAVILGGSAYAGAAVLIGWLATARLILVAAPPISSALVALGRPGWSVLANVAMSLLCLAVLPLALSRLGLVGAGVQAGLQALATAALLVLLFWRATADAVSHGSVAAQP